MNVRIPLTGMISYVDEARSYDIPEAPKPYAKQ